MIIATDPTIKTPKVVLTKSETTRSLIMDYLAVIRWLLILGRMMIARRCGKELAMSLVSLFIALRRPCWPWSGAKQ